MILPPNRSSRSIASSVGSLVGPGELGDPFVDPFADPLGNPRVGPVDPATRIDQATRTYILHQVPLAQTVLGLLQFALHPDFLGDLFERHRGLGYEKELSFAKVVDILVAAITSKGTIHQALKQADANQDLPVSFKAVYGKISRVPLPLSLGLLHEGTQRLRDLLACPSPLSTPASNAPQHGVPTCFDGLQVLLVDGKKSKNVAKRLKVCRDQPGKVFGAKLLVCLEARTRLVLAASADADGERNDNPLVPSLLDRLRPGHAQPALIVCDAQFCDLVQVRNMIGEQARFAFRHHPKTHFHADPARPARRWTDAQGRTLVEEFGHLGSPKDARRCYVRRVIWLRANATHKDLGVVTNLTDADAHPAEAMIDLYLMRWKIETVFQEVATVFGLQHLIGSTPEASALETAMCMLIYNLIQVVKLDLAQERAMAVDDVSSHSLFLDVHRQMVGLATMLSSADIAESIETPSDPAAMRVWLRARLSGQWKKGWTKARNKTKRTYRPKPQQSGAHTSIERLRRKHKKTNP